MRKLKLLTLMWFVTALLSAPAAAQTCLGLPSFAGGAIRLNLSGEFADSSKVYAAGIGAGKQNSIFGTIGGGLVEFEGLAEKAKFGFLELGYQIPLGKAQFCPIVGGSLGNGPDDDASGFKVTTQGGTAGGALGLPLTLGSLTLIPNVAARYSHATLKVEEEGVGESEETFKTGLLDLGLALIFRDRISVQPLVHIPFGGDDEETTLGVFVSISFGPRL